MNETIRVYMPNSMYRVLVYECNYEGIYAEFHV